jgi:hypothetical protein
MSSDSRRKSQARKCRKCKAPAVPRRRLCEKHAAISDRYKAKAKLCPDQAKAVKRVAELNAIYWHHFPDKVLPNNELGRKWARYIVRTIAFLPADRRSEWLEPISKLPTAVDPI